MNVPGKSKANVQKRFFKLRIMSLKFKNVQEKFFLFEIQNLLYSVQCLVYVGDGCKTPISLRILHDSSCNVSTVHTVPKLI